MRIFRQDPCEWRFCQCLDHCAGDEPAEERSSNIKGLRIRCFNAALRDSARTTDMPCELRPVPVQPGLRPNHETKAPGFLSFKFPC